MVCAKGQPLRPFLLMFLSFLFFRWVWSLLPAVGFRMRPPLRVSVHGRPEESRSYFSPLFPLNLFLFSFLLETNSLLLPVRESIIFIRRRLLIFGDDGFPPTPESPPFSDINVPPLSLVPPPPIDGDIVKSFTYDLPDGARDACSFRVWATDFSHTPFFPPAPLFYLSSPMSKSLAPS